MLEHEAPQIEQKLFKNEPEPPKPPSTGQYQITLGHWRLGLLPSTTTSAMTDG